MEKKGKDARKQSPKEKNTLRRVLLIILGLLLIAAAIIGYQLEKKKNSPEGVFATYYEIHPNDYHSVTQGSQDVMDRAFAAYEIENYSEAAEFLGQRIASSNAIPLKFFQAMAYGEMGNLPLAIKNLENIRRFDSPYIDESYWYLGLYYAKQQNKDAAVKRMQDFYELNKDPKRKKAAADIIHHLQGN